MDAVATLPVAIDEETVRRLCGAAFAQADAFQRGGHVLGPRRTADGLDANVRGTWQRVDRVSVLARVGKLQPSCGRDGAVYCRHVGALLLHWLRAPATFTVVVPPSDGAAPPVPRPGGLPVPAEPESPATEFARLLDRDTVNHLREIGRRRGVRPAGTKKAEVIRQLTSELAQPEGIEQAIAALSDDERLALDAVHLAGAVEPAQEPAITAAYQALGGAGKPSLTELLDAGLVLIAHPPYYGVTTYLVPRVVAARLPALDNLARRGGGEKAGPARAALGIVELLQVIALELAAGADPGAGEAAGPEDDGQSALPGFAVEPAPWERTAHASPTHQTGLALTPRRSLVATTLERMAARTGQPIDVVDFGVRLLLGLEIAQSAPHVAVRTDRLQALLDLTPAVRLGKLTQAWLATAGSFELGLLAGEGGRLRLRWQPFYAYYVQSHPILPAIAAAARLVARLVGRLAAGPWYDLGSFVETVERLTPAAAPALTQLRTSSPTGQALLLGWRTDRGKEEPLALGTPDGWSRFLPALVAALLGGPLRWLGLVELVTRPDRSGALRVRPAVGVLTERELPAAPVRSSAVVVGDDLTVLVPAGTTDVSIHGDLARAGELVEASAAGLRYRLTAAGMQAVFATGTTGPEFAASLTKRAGGALPPAAVRTLDRWWSGYGTVRLYDELALIEFGDDVLLAEVLAATPLAAALVHTFSPRQVAIEPARVAEVVAELTARGFAPRVVEEE